MLHTSQSLILLTSISDWTHLVHRLDGSLSVDVGELAQVVEVLQNGAFFLVEFFETFLYCFLVIIVAIRA